MSKYYNYLLFAYISLLNLPAFAVFEKAITIMDKVKDGLMGLSLVTVTLAIMLVGYKILFGGNTIGECKFILIGAGLIGMAGPIAKMIL